MKVTHLIIALNVLVFVAMLRLGGPKELMGFSDHTLLVAGANYGPLAREGQVFRLLTSVFIHMNVLHIAMNMGSIQFAGAKLEPHYGRLRFAALYLGTGVFGAVVSAVWYTVMKTDAISAGASGAAMGLNGAAIILGHYATGPDARAFRNSMVMWAGSTLLFGVAIHADNAAHLGGLVAGLAVGWVWKKHQPRAKQDEMGLETLILLALVGGSFAMAIRARDTAQTEGEIVNASIDVARSGDLDGAIVGYQRALKMSPNDSIALYDLGLAYRMKREHEKAIKALQASIAVKPTKKNLSALADELIAIGDRAGASAAIHQASDADEDW